MQSLLVRPQAAIVRPCGSLNAANAAECQQQFHTAVLSEQNSALLIDMSQVESLDSAGLMALVSTLNLAQANQKRLSLCSVTVSIRIVFELTQLDRVFEIFESLSAFELATA
ncbi:MAG: STAS domain-containing protein [Plectolyngbya sp. WJT66-NPBG17]|jgi:anti-anti-sigma factor|nr:STAS domain-containing protein [Plectolyngbya sp. WJT66-NPBG17]MBW4525574.1 STAS domain-containing protein [Phormidium tanganyikae FI6-MK23]